MKHIRNLTGSSTSTVSLVTLEEQYYVLKTAETVEIENERAFNKLLLANGYPTLKEIAYSELLPNQILLEYIPDSPTLGSNLSPQLCHQWGILMSHLHSLHSPHATHITDSQHIISWDAFITSEIEDRYRSSKPTSLSKETLFALISPILFSKNQTYSLLHGDCHSNNILIKNNDLVLFDKASQIFFGDPLYDLAIVALEFPNKRYIDSTDAEHQQDVAYLESFISGYGTNFTENPLFDCYVLLHSVLREPNPFQPYLGEVIAKLIKKLS